MMGAQEWLWIGHWCCRCFWGCWGVDLGGSVLVMSISGVVISGVFFGCFWMVMGGNGCFKIITKSFVK